jgi:polyphosphate glucokinase
MRILVIDIGGTNVKVLVSGADARRDFESGPTLTPAQMVEGVKAITKDWKYEAVSIGFPAPVVHNRPFSEPHNLGRGWVGFNFRRAFGRPVKIINDAAMQALGSYKKGKMLFLGLGTGLGSAMVVDGIVEPMELAHLPYKKATYEDYAGVKALKKRGKKKWRRDVAQIVEQMMAALEPDEIVLGGGNAKKLKQLPPHCRLGDNSNAFLGGFRLWKQEDSAPRASRPEVRSRKN